MNLLKKLLKRFGSPEAAHLKTGVVGEKLAESFLKKLNYTIIGRRVLSGKHDELDLIARDGEILVFVEVKTRKRSTKGRPLDGVDKRKRYTLSRAAMGYMKKLRKKPKHFRFDVIEVILEETGESDIRHHERAFSLDDRFRVNW